MKSKRVFAQKLSQGIVTMLALAMLAAAPTATAQAKRYTVLHDFTDTNGAFPRGNLIFDASGNLYGVTGGGGIVNKAECLPAFNFTSCGTVFKLTKASGGGWAGKVLYEFTGGSDGANPQAGLVFDSAGNLYGTTYAGGLYGFGVAFELSPNPDG